jgi:hypothetical protein
VSDKQLIVDQDRADTRRAALVQASTRHGYNNSHVSDAVAAYAELFIGVFSCDSLARRFSQALSHVYRGAERSVLV